MSDEDQFWYYIELGDSLYYDSYSDCEEKYKSAIELASANHDLSLEAEGQYALGMLYWDRGDYANALVCDHRALRIYTQLEDDPNIAMTTMGLGVTLSEMGMNELAMGKYIVAREMYKEEKDLESLCLLHMNIGVAFSAMGNTNEAMSNYLEALRIADNLNLKEERADIYLNLGSELEDSLAHESLIYYEKALEIYIEENIQNNMALVMGNLATTHSTFEDYGKAKSYALKGKDIAERLNDNSTLAYIYYALADHGLSTGNHEDALAFLDSCEVISDDYNYLSQKVDIEHLRSKIYSSQGQYDLAYKAALVYSELSDSLKLANDASKTDLMMVVFKTEQQDKQIALLETQAEADKTQDALKTAMLVVCIIAALLLALFAVSRYRALSISRKTNAQLTTVNSQLAREKKMAEVGILAKSEFLSTMTHELRTPLNAVLGTINMMLMDKHTSEQKENLDILKFSSSNLLHLINNILDFSKLEADKVLLEQNEVRIHELLNQILSGSRVSAKSKKIELSGQWDDDLPRIIRTDSTRLTQVLTNLVGNAIKFTENGQVTLRVEVLNSSPETCGLRFSVIDTGIGISDEKKALIFESFSQGETFITRKYGGSGLGLAISRRIVQMLGGDLRVNSEKGKGSEFYFEMECSIAAHTEAQPINDTLTPEEIIRLKDRKILVVDDNKLNLLVTTNMLAMKGIEVHQSLSGTEAVALCDKEDYDLVFMDLQMPEMDGYEATSKIMKSNKNTRVIALTASSKEEMAEREEAVLFDGFLRKPVDLTQILKTLKKIT